MTSFRTGDRTARLLLAALTVGVATLLLAGAVLCWGVAGALAVGPVAITLLPLIRQLTVTGRTYQDETWVR